MNTWVGALIGQFGWYANLFAFVLLFSQEIPANEGNVGPPLKLTGLGIGCWLWLLSQLLVLGGNFDEAKQRNAATS